MEEYSLIFHALEFFTRYLWNSGKPEQRRSRSIRVPLDFHMVPSNYYDFVRFIAKSWCPDHFRKNTRLLLINVGPTFIPDCRIHYSSLWASETRIKTQLYSLIFFLKIKMHIEIGIFIQKLFHNIVGSSFSWCHGTLIEPWQSLIVAIFHSE